MVAQRTLSTLKDTLYDMPSGIAYANLDTLRDIVCEHKNKHYEAEDHENGVKVAQLFCEDCGKVFDPYEDHSY